MVATLASSGLEWECGLVFPLHVLLIDLVKAKRVKGKDPTNRSALNPREKHHTCSSDSSSCPLS